MTCASGSCLALEERVELANAPLYSGITWEQLGIEVSMNWHMNCKSSPSIIACDGRIAMPSRGVSCTSYTETRLAAWGRMKRLEYGVGLQGQSE